MHALAGILAAGATPTPTPSRTGVDPALVTPGPAGFIAVAFITVAVILLVWDMLRRVRRARYREEVGKQLDAEQAEQADRAVLETEADDQSVDAQDDPAPPQR